MRADRRSRHSIRATGPVGSRPSAIHTCTPTHAHQERARAEEGLGADRVEGRETNHTALLSPAPVQRERERERERENLSYCFPEEREGDRDEER